MRERLQNLCEVLGRVFQISCRNLRRHDSKPHFFCLVKRNGGRFLEEPQENGFKTHFFLLRQKETGFTSQRKRRPRGGERDTLRVSFHSPPLRLTPSGAKESPKGAVSHRAGAPCRETTALPQKRLAPGVIPKRGDGPSLAVKGGLGVNRKTPSRLFFGDPKPRFF